MVTPEDIIKDYEGKLKYVAWLLTFSLGGFSNMLPFLDYSEITIEQLLLLGVDTACLAISLLIFVYYRIKIRDVGREALI